MRGFCVVLLLIWCWRRPVTGRPGAKQFVEHTLFYAAVDVGEREYYGLQERWPSSVLRRLMDIGSRIDTDLWESGVYNGYSDAKDREDSVDYPEGAELRY